LPLFFSSLFFLLHLSYLGAIAFLCEQPRSSINPINQSTFEVYRNPNPGPEESATQAKKRSQEMSFSGRRVSILRPSNRRFSQGKGLSENGRSSMNIPSNDNLCTLQDISGLTARFP
jgi:hypothetical protein